MRFIPYILSGMALTIVFLFWFSIVIAMYYNLYDEYKSRKANRNWDFPVAKCAADAAHLLEEKEFSDENH